MHATDVNPLFHSALLLSALPVPLLRQVGEGWRIHFFVFLRFGRVLIPDFFPLFFLSASFEHSSMTFVDLVGSQGLLRDPNGSHFGSSRGQIWV